jgi:hypothetical protein
MLRPLLALLVPLLVAVGCATDDDDPDGDDRAAVDSSTTTTVTTEPSATGTTSPETVPAPVWSVAMTANWSGVEGVDDGGASVAVEFDPGDRADDPFGEVGSCSGLRERVGAYSVFASDGDDAVSVWTADRVTAPGDYDVEVRIERAEGPIRASGTLTVRDELQRGEFVGVTPEGGRVDGEFECAGAPPPTPLVPGEPGDGTIDSVEVFVIVRDGGAERVLGLAASGDDDVDCPAVSGTGGETIVRAEGDARLGAITMFELAGGAEPTLELRFGDVSYDFAEVGVQIGPDGASGTFTGTSGGVSVDGAFLCT